MQARPAASLLVQSILIDRLFLTSLPSPVQLCPALCRAQLVCLQAAEGLDSSPLSGAREHSPDSAEEPGLHPFQDPTEAEQAVEYGEQHAGPSKQRLPVSRAARHVQLPPEPEQPVHVETWKDKVMRALKYRVRAAHIQGAASAELAELLLWTAAGSVCCTLLSRQTEHWCNKDSS